MNIKKKIIFRIVILLAVSLLAAAPSAMAFSPSHYADSSKLAKGNWVRLRILTSGIYQITDEDAHSWGFSGADAIHVFGKGGAPISETLTADIPDDLPQVPVVRTSGKLCFYAQGATTWGSRNNMAFVQIQHPYATAAYYYVTDDSGYSDIDITKADNSPGDNPATTFIERLFHESELANPTQSGRELLGENLLLNSSFTQQFTLDGIVDGSKVNVFTEAGAHMPVEGGSAYFAHQYNGKNLSVATEDRITADNGSYVYRRYLMPKSFTLDSDNKLSYTVKLVNSGASINTARLNFITVNYTRRLSMGNTSLCFTGDSARTMALTGVTDGTRIWDVTVPSQPVEMNATVSGNTATFAPIADGVREYVAFNPNGAHAVAEGKEHVANQNLHGQPVPDMLIITNARYKQQAERIAALHETQDSMRVLVVTQEEVFNEFSSGSPDAMAYRMACKMFYDRGDEGGHRLGYLLLMGNGSFDNRQLTSEFKGIAYPALLTWESPESNTKDSYCTDDCFGVLADGSGPKWNLSELSIAVGRFPVKSENEAKVAVDKLIKYCTNPEYDIWKNQLLVVADDENGAQFMKDSEDLIDIISNNGGKALSVKRVYLDSYDATSIGSTRTYPQARKEMYGKLSEGALWWNYQGHSSPNVISGHNLVQRNDYLNNMYFKHLPVVFGATCELSRYDAIEESGAENMFLNPNGGCIAIISAAREVNITGNSSLNNHVATYAFKRDADGNATRIGDSYRLGNNKQRTANSLRYMLLGDPAMRLALPRYTVKVETINGKPVNPDSLPVFEARQNVTFAGSIVDGNGNKATNFNGSVIGTLYDCEQSITTHGYGAPNAEPRDNDYGVPFTYQEHTNKIAIKNDTVVGGSFKMSINITSELADVTFDNYTPSLLNLYACDTKQGIDAMGAFDDFYIYGIDESQPADTVGPEIQFLCLNNQEFSDGDQVNESPLVLASFGDKSGVNFSTAGIGHIMTLTLDGTTTFSDLNGYYTPQVTSEGTWGSISYPLNELSEGRHTLRLRVWDVYNNFTDKTIEFVVVKGLKPEITEVYSTSNPASVSTEFYVRHNRPGSTLNVGIEVYDIMGRLVWNTRQSGKSDMYTSFPITWDLTDNSGSRLPHGIYIYRATISTDGVRETTKSKKIAVTD